MPRFLLLLVLGATIGCAQISKMPDTAPASLAESFKPFFKIGAAIDHESYISHKNLLLEQFNSAVTENEMKFMYLQPVEGQFSFATADEMINFARENKMYTRGHALVWHRQTPDWVFEDEQGNQASAQVLRKRMKSHINSVMNHFKGRIDAWDVVNEAFMDDGKLRTNLEEKDDQKSAWFGILGKSYLEDAFRFAHEADPNAKLFYNDYYNYLPAKQNAIYNMLKSLIDKGVPIHGVGLQCHLNVEPSKNPEHQSFYQTIENLEKAIQLYASLGLEVQITELDLSVYIGGEKYTPENFVTPDTFDESFKQQQAQRYKALFDMFKRNSDAITNVTFWGIADDNTWLSEFDSGRQDFPMLFDLNHQPKPAFFEVITVAQEK